MRQIPVRDDGLQINEDRRFQERYWTAERVAWMAFGLILIAALAGLTGGGGPLAQQKVQIAGGEVVAPRFARWVAADRIEVTFAPGAERHTLSLAPEFLQSFQVEGITPTPETSVAIAGGMQREFETSEAPPTVALLIRPERAGRVAFRAALDGSDPVEIITWILP